MKLSRRPGIRTVLLGLSLAMLALPIGGIVILRIYESALVRQTETGLITQSALVAAQFRETLLRDAPVNVSSRNYGRTVDTAPTTEDEPWQPRPSTLDLATSEVLPVAPATAVDGVADEIARRAGESIQPVLVHAQKTTLAGLRVTDYTGVVVASTGEDSGHYLGTMVEVQKALAGTGVSTLRHRESPGPNVAYSSISRGAALRVYVSTPVFMDDRVVGSVLAIRTPRTLGAAMYANRKLLLIGALGLLLLSVAAGLIVSYAIVRPIKQLRTQALRAVDGEPGAMTPLARPVTHDIHQLSVAVSTMARTLEQRANYMREFANHVSHEFKTPLTAIRGSIELLQDHAHTMTTDERERFLSNLDANAIRLEKLVKELLQLSTATDRRHATGSLKRALGDVVMGFAETNVTLELHTDGNHDTVAMAGSTLVSVFTSIVDNAFDHGASAATLVAEPDGSMVVVSVRDNGPGIAAEHHDRIFEAFFTTRKDPSGHGLGLAIVASLINSHGGSIRSLASKSGGHIEVRLPAASGVSP